MHTGTLVAPPLDPTPSMALTTFMLSSSATLPKTTCLPSKCPVTAVVTKNCDPFVLGPELAMESSPGTECRTVPLVNSSSNLAP
mmetsp:Transcript_12776/g.15565  ORF Transcript_12776/g.15565 Transcript_12776/m.15565 type:complete len:84 (-) Transcript_12776:78-329(-)